MNLSILFRYIKTKKLLLFIFIFTLFLSIVMSNIQNSYISLNSMSNHQHLSFSWDLIIQIFTLLQGKINGIISDQAFWNRNLDWVTFLDQQQGLFSLLALWMSPLYTERFWVIIGVIFICLILFLTIFSLMRNFTSRQNNLTNYILLARNFLASFLAIFVVFAAFIIINNIVLYLLVNIFNSNIFNMNFSLILFNSSFAGISNPYQVIPTLYLNVSESFNLVTFSIYLKIFSIILFLLNFLFIYLYFKIILMLISSPFKVSKVINNDWSEYLLFLKTMMLLFMQILLNAIYIFLALSWSSLIQEQYSSSLLAKPLNIVLIFSLLITPLISSVKFRKRIRYV